LEKRSLRFIVNPFSGLSSKKDFSERVGKFVDSEKNNIEIIYTEAPAHAIQLAKEAVQQNIDMVVAVGGDGTVNEVGSALAHSDTILGVVPGGSGNGFAMHLGIGRNQNKALGFLDQGKMITIDSCTVNDQFFINLAGVGFDASVAYYTKQSKKRGFQIYFTTSMKEALRYQNKSYKISYDGQTIEDKFLSVNIANASMFGYNFVIAPFANLQDGVLDMVLIKDASKAKYITSVWRFLNKTIHKSSFVDIIRTKEVTISSDEPMHLHMDGEGKIVNNSLTFKIHPQSLKLWVPHAHHI